MTKPVKPRAAMIAALGLSGVTRAELARRLGCSQPFTTKILRADRGITLKTLTAVVEACGFELVITLAPLRKKDRGL